MFINNKISIVISDYIIKTESGFEYTAEGYKYAEEIFTHSLVGNRLEAFELLHKLKPDLKRLFELGVIPYVITDNDYIEYCKLSANCQVKD